MKPIRLPHQLCALAACASVWQAFAQPLRDPTQPPAAFSAPAGTARAPVETFKPQHLIVVDGVRYLIWNHRRYAVGETVDGARIERISEDEVWLRRADGLRKLPLYSGIEKRPPTSGSTTNTSTRTGVDGKNGPTK
jgi:hypothetical protein